MSNTLQSWVLRQLPSSATDAFYQWRHKRRWEHDPKVHEEYFASYQERGPIIDAVIRVLDEHQIAEPRILEFGCSGGNNLRLLRERFDRPVRYCGLDIQERGIAFARQQFPDDEFYASSATTRAELPCTGHFDVFLASGVLLYLSQPQAQNVLAMAAQVSDHQVVCDYMERFDLSNGTNNGTFVHPFGAMCAASGLSVAVSPYLPKPTGLGIFVTKTA